MPRKPRFFIPNVPVHVVQRGHSREPVFFENQYYQAYLNWLREGAIRYNCLVHAYVLMTNHIHVLVTPSDTDGITRTMQYIGRRYVPYVNYKYGSSGTLWEGRYKASLVQEDCYLLTCMRYIELNPVRANMVQVPQQYLWSSYLANGFGKQDKLITTHELYQRLGASIKERCKNYRALFKTHLDIKELEGIKSAC